MGVKLTTNSASQKTKIRFQYLLNEILEHEDIESAKKLANMILNKEVKITIRDDTKLLFIFNSKYEGKCIRCEEVYTYGDPIFCSNKRAWHLKCRTQEEEKQSYFQTCLRKGLLNEFLHIDKSEEVEDDNEEKDEYDY